MRLTRLKLENFRRFKALDITPLDPALTVIVGPNGAGKSTLFHALAMANLALRWAAQGDSDAYASLQIYDAALRQGGGAGHFLVRLGLEFTEAWEERLILSFVHAIVASALADRQPPLEPARLEQYLDTITLDQLRPLLNGDLAIAYSTRPFESWLIAYGFEFGGAPYYLGLGGGIQAGHLMAGEMPTQPSSSLVGFDLPTRLVSLIDKGLPFSMDALLPEAGQGSPAQIKTSAAQRSTRVGDFLSQIGANLTTGREYNAASVLHRIFRSSLTLLSDQRLPPQTTYDISELGQRPTLTDGAKVPLELYRLKNGDAAERTRYATVQSLFHTLTGVSTELTARPLEEAGQTMALQPTVIDAAGWEVPITLAGAGLWEALILATILVGEPGMVAALDEPATNLSPTPQRRLAGQLAARGSTQVLAITHSPYLVPMRDASDLRRIIRISIDPAQGTSTMRRLVDDVGGDTKIPGRSANWRQILAGRADVRSALFAAGVILVEGETELGALDQWFSDTELKGQPALTPEALNLLILPVGGAGQFGEYVAFLSSAGIPWTIVSDGPVLSPNYSAGTSLLVQLRRARIISESAPTPSETATFDEWKDFWRHHKVHTLATRFGGLDKGTKDKSGEIEAFFQTIDADRWAADKATYDKSKVRAGYSFAAATRCPAAVSDLYAELLHALVGEDSVETTNPLSSS